jgi:hypothetical protein
MSTLRQRVTSKGGTTEAALCPSMPPPWHCRGHRARHRSPPMRADANSVTNLGKDE